MFGCAFIDCYLLSLQTLCLDGNRLDSLPEELGSLVQLCSLGLSFNDFPHIPGVVERLCTLDKLAMAGNRVETLDLCSLLRMTHIKSIDLRWAVRNVFLSPSLSVSVRHAVGFTCLRLLLFLIALSVLSVSCLYVITLSSDFMHNAGSIYNSNVIRSAISKSQVTAAQLCLVALSHAARLQHRNLVLFVDYSGRKSLFWQERPTIWHIKHPATVCCFLSHVWAVK